ncbi:MAG: hypothetical protein ACRDNO_21655 [Trebonia sp.]
MSILRANRSARLRDHPRKRRIRFRQAVPVRRDRRELRRLFRRAARAALAERQNEMTALLGRLSADHALLSEVVPGPRPSDGVVEFLDGTRLLLVTRRGSNGLGRLTAEHGATGAIVCLIRAQPSFATCWFRLWFAAVGAQKPAEVLAKVRPAPAPRVGPSA